VAVSQVAIVAGVRAAVVLGAICLVGCSPRTSVIPEAKTLRDEDSKTVLQHHALASIEFCLSISNLVCPGASQSIR